MPGSANATKYVLLLIMCDSIQCVLYTPEAPYIGVDRFTYSVINDAGNTETANIEVVVVQFKMHIFFFGYIMVTILNCLKFFESLGMAKF